MQKEESRPILVILQKSEKKQIMSKASKTIERVAQLLIFKEVVL